MRQHSQPLNGDLGRQTTITNVEEAIASRWWRKDPNLQIYGMKKRVVGNFCGFIVCLIDSEWIRDNLDTTFGTGGHGLVHTFIPLKEIWIDPVNEPPENLIFHEIMEFHYMMEDGMNYWDAHQKALAKQNGRILTLGNVENNLKVCIQGTIGAYHGR